MMLPFQKVPIVLPGNPNDESEPDKEIFARIQPADISHYHDGYHWGCLIYMKSGEMVMTRLTADEVEHALGVYWQKVGEQMRRMQAGPAILPVS